MDSPFAKDPNQKPVSKISKLKAVAPSFGWTVAFRFWIAPTKLVRTNRPTYMSSSTVPERGVNPCPRTANTSYFSLISSSPEGRQTNRTSKGCLNAESSASKTEADESPPLLEGDEVRFVD
jgi:hypothetical protein